MAISISDIYHEIQDSAQTGTSFNFAGSLTTENSSLAVAVLAINNFDFTESFTNPAMSGGSLTWTRRLKVITSPPASSFQAGLVVFTAPVTTGATFTPSVSGLTTTGSGFRWWSLVVASVLGYDTGSPIGASVTDTNTGNDAVNITLSGAPAATSVVIAGRTFVANGNGGIGDPGTGWTTLYDTDATGAGTNILHTMYNIGTTSTTVPWDDIIVGDSNFGAQVEIAIEIKAAAGGGVSIIPHVQHHLQNLKKAA